MSEKKVFILENLDLRQSPGLPQGLKAYRDFSPCVNIIYGPNASGKSSTVRAVLQLIWQQERRGVILNAEARLGEDRWVFQVDHRPVLTQKNGITDHLSGIPAAEEKNHYSLSIDDLFVDDHAELAGEISRQAIGGFDLEKAARNLKYSDQILTAAIKEYKDYKEANQEVWEIKKNQENLKEDQNRLANLIKEEEEAREAQNQLDFFEKVLAYLEKSAEVEILETELGNYPENCALLTGSEWEQVEELEKDIEESKEKIRKFIQEMEASQEKLTSLNLPAAEFSSDLVNELRERVRRLENKGRSVEELEAEIIMLKKKMEHCLSSIAPGIDSEIWRGLDLQPINELDALLSEAHRLLSRKHMIRNQIDHLDRKIEEIPAADHSEETLREGLTELSEWLKTESVDHQYSTVLMVLLGLGSAGAGLYWLSSETESEAVAVFLIINSIILLGLYFFRNSSAKNNQLASWQKRYEGGKMKLPAEWNSVEVSARIGEIVSELDRVIRLRQMEGERRQWIKDLSQNESRLASLDQKMDRFRSLYGAAPELPEFGEEDFTTFYWFVKSVTDWQDLSRECEAVIRKRDHFQKEGEAELQRINDFFDQYFEAEPAMDGVAAEARFLQIDEDVRTRDKIRNELKHQSERKQEALIRLEAQEKKLAELFDSVKIRSGDKQHLRQVLDQLKGFQEAKRKYDSAQSVLRERYQKMENHSLFKSEEIEETIWTPDQLKQKMEDLAQIAEKYLAFRDDRTSIEIKIGEKQKEDQLEKALNAKRKALEALEERYAENLHSRAGALLVSQLAEKTHEMNQPQIVKRANQLLGKITRHRYELLSAQGSERSFWIKDLRNNVGLELHELSAGTRVQLLLAIKIAYLELQESSVKLPLLADELLANSDDIRSPAIIEALTELSREGRQIFYFTAQWDEMRAWTEYLEKEGVHYQTYHLGEVHENRSRPVVEDVFPLVLKDHDIPAPNEMSYTEYGELLRLDYHLLEDEPDQLHLYFLMENTENLYFLLDKGIHNWGQLKHFFRQGGQVDQLSAEMKNKMEEKIQLLHRYQTLYRTGRPRRISRMEIEDSGAVSDAHMENVMALLHDVDGNPERLIDGLEDRKVARFHTNKIEELQEYLTRQGFLDEAQKLTEDEIQISLQAQLSQLEFLRPEEADQFLNRIIQIQSSSTDDHPSLFSEELL